MKVVLKTVPWSFLILLIVWGVGSFVSLDTNVSHWQEDSRALASLFWAGGSCGALVLVAASQVRPIV